MEIGIFSIGDLTADPVHDTVPSETERLKALCEMARHAEAVGLDVFAVGEHHAPGHVPPSPAVLLSFIAAGTRRIRLSTATTLITTNDPVRIAEEYATLQNLAGDRIDLMVGRGNDASVYPLFGQDIDESYETFEENCRLLRRLWQPGPVSWSGRARPPLTDFTSVPRPLRGTQPQLWHAASNSPRIAEIAARSGARFFVNNLFWPMERYARLVDLYRERFSAADHATGHGGEKEPVVGIGGQVFIAHRSQQAVAEFRPYFDRAPIYGNGVSLEEYCAHTPLTVGSPAQVIERAAEFRERFGRCARQLFLVDHAGLPLKTVCEQIDHLGDIAPLLRRELSRE